MKSPLKHGKKGRLQAGAPLLFFSSDACGVAGGFGADRTLYSGWMFLKRLSC